MTPKSPKNRQEQILNCLQQIKAFLSKDFSLQDLKNIRLISRPRHLSTRSMTLDIAQFQIWGWQLVQRYQQTLLILGLLVLLGGISLFLLLPYGKSLEQRMQMLPAQWSQLQNLIKLSKSAAGNASASSQSWTSPSTLPLLDEFEMQKIKTVLTARGIKPSILRVTADTPPRVELQSNEVMFSVFLEVLEELRMTWRLYPDRVRVEATQVPGMVNVSASLSQASSASTSSGSGQ